MYNNKLYKIKTLSNLHVGGGDANYSVIDKQVQRDSLSDNYPTIHASSFKGAMREYTKFSEVSKQKLTKDGEVSEEAKLAGNGIIYTVFGQEPKAENNADRKQKAGHVVFAEPKLLSLPVRTNKKAFMHATCPAIINAFNATCNIYDLDAKMPEFLDADAGYYCKDALNEELIAEEFTFLLNRNESLSSLEEHIGNNVALLTDEQFKTIAKNLPVIARNYLENGESKNLFYEEVVPRETFFYTVLRYPNDNLLSMDPRDYNGKKNILSFQNNIKNIKFYLGANTSIGQGLCELKQVSPKLEENDG